MAERTPAPPAGTDDRHIDTIAAQIGHYIDRATGGIAPPIQPSTTFARDRSYALTEAGREYARDNAPIYEVFEAVMCQLEGGVAALVFPSGMAAIAAFFRSFQAGDRLVVQSRGYFNTLKWLRGFAARRGVELAEFDPREPDALARALASGASAVWIETPANPTWDVVDIAAAADAAHAAGAILAVDNTVATPVLTNPLALGADVVMHSATKYLNGHSDVLAGALVARAEDDRWAVIRQDRHDAGALLGPFEAWLLLRGLRTLVPRLRLQCASALTVAQWLAAQRGVAGVLYPGLADHPGHPIAARQMRGGFGGMLSILVEGGADEALAFVAGLETIIPATSLGGVESLIEHRATVEGGLTDVPANLLRLSVGVEHVDDLIADLERGLAAV
jgi:cystathionine gamma-synthase